MTHTLTVKVDTALSAEEYGNEGFAVLATPALVGLMERCAIESLAPSLQPGQGSVGIHIGIDHLAATPLGFTATVTCTLTAIEDRILHFAIEASDGMDLIARATHRRAIVDMAKFQARLGAKAAKAS
ncbi:MULTISPECIES: thioesterase family protein [Bordetella]|nr:MULTISPECIES: thioesterase family protein [Bordetella]